MRDDAFRRYLSAAALDRALKLRPVLVEWSRRSECAVELRRGDEIVLYESGSRVHTINLSAAQETASHEASIRAAMEQGREGSGELGAQSRLFPGTSGFVILDQQIAIPSSALRDLSFAGHRVDLLLLEAAPGKLWLVELKLAEGDDLHLAEAQLAMTAALPEALREGKDEFVSHYRRVLEQKQTLGLLDASLRILEPSIETALLVVGSRDAADARIACWERPPSNGLFAHAVDALPKRSAYEALAVTHARALDNSARPGFAPRRSRHTGFAQSEDRLRSHEDLGQFASVLGEYFSKHSAARHTHLNHRRSSQSLCLQLFAPAFVRDPAALSALSDAFSPCMDGAGLSAFKIDRVHFEAPHHDCRVSGCELRLDVRAALGEGSKHTSLDALLVGTAVRDGRSVSVGVGVEFKYTEPEFGSCGGFTSSANLSAASCLGHRATGLRPCHLKKLERVYLRDEVRTSWFRSDPLEQNPCELLGPQNQLYRSHFTTEAMALHMRLDESLFAVAWHQANPVLMLPELPIPGVAAFGQSPTDRYRASLRQDRANRFGLVTVASVLAAYARHASDAAWFRELKSRYGF